LAKQELEEAAHYYDSESLVSDLSFFEKSSNASNPSSIIRKERRFSRDLCVVGWLAVFRTPCCIPSSLREYASWR